jgi:penicillin-binding protein 1A
MTQRQRRRHRRRAHNGSIAGKLMIVAVVVIATVAIAGLSFGGWVLSVADDAPPLSACRPIDQGGNSIIYAADGSRLGFIASDEAHQPVSIKRIPTDMRYSTVAIEDQRFYQHDGIDVEGGLRALIENINAGKIVQGGSTITMQLMRNLCITDPKRDIVRKIQEAELALEYEKKHSKQEILGQYLNSASYGTINGRTAVGVQAAAKIYYSKPVWKLTLEQAALLAGLPQAPSEYNPILNPRGALERRNEVLDKMADLGYISRRRALEGEQRKLELNPSDEYFQRREPYFFDYVENVLLEKYGVNNVRQGGLKVYTTIEPRLQKIGRDAINSTLYYPDDPSSALVAIDPRSGNIKAMVSSGSYGSNQYNLAAQGHRQAGSTFKAFVLTTAIKQGIDPYSTYYTSMPLNLDLPEWGHWEVHTADEGYQGTINLQQATVASDNTVFAQLDLDVGPENVAETAKSMGITSPLDGIPAEGLGGLRIGVSPLEMADAYATLASGGIHHNPIAVRKVEFPSGRVDHPEEADPKRVLPEAVAYEVTRILHDNITYGTGTAAYTGCSGQAGKTGTVDRYTDAWFMGYQPNLSTGVWVGYPQSNAIEMTSVHGITVFGGTFPAEIWNSFYSTAGVPCEEFPVPSEPINWSSFFGSYTASDPSTYDYSTPDTTSSDKGKKSDGGGSGKTYDPQLYAPGAGQEPAPAPPSPPAAGPPPSNGGGNIGGGQPTGGLGGGP